jgi:DNA-binding NarL/FixJ family response regulator
MLKPAVPGMSGHELLPKANAARPDLPVIMITAYDDADTRRKALEGGAEAMLMSERIRINDAPAASEVVSYSITSSA